MTASQPRRRADGAIETGDGVQPVLDQKVDGGSLYQLRASAAACGSEAGLSAQRSDDLVIAVHELAANVVRHGSGRGRLRIWKHHQVLHCQVTDEGAAPDPTPPPWKILPGHGLWLVRQLADRTSLHPGPNGTAVTISFKLDPADGLPFTDVPGPMLRHLRETGLGGRFTIADSADEAYGGVSAPP
jgi:anti-sigma regulatory factor (Ser/Thr protein kinase)